MNASAPKREVLFEGLSHEEILNLPKEEVDQLILLGEPIVCFKFKVDRRVAEPIRKTESLLVPF
jgi:hypothetical protein